ncbi:MAG: flagellar assembly peptidoglycan hydrolase FlgJ [Gammaproteobacteria bacterium]|nr:flagellar assembly peptidoglycan hydrolase FlgJ [Gammaproteobacteria bacterium]
MLDQKSSINQAQIYTDMSGLSKLRVAAQKNSPDAIEAVAKQFESLFMNLMLKSMREANAVFAEGNYLNSSETDTYQQMLDQQLSVTLSEGRGIGLADVLVRQLGGEQKTAKKADNNIATLFSSDKIKTDKSLNKLNNIQTKINKEIKPVFEKNQLIEAQQLNKPVKQLNNNSDQLKQDPSRLAVIKENKAAKFDKAILPDHIIESAEAFVDKLLPAATRASEKLGLDPKLLIAQAALETGWGKHLLTNSSGKNSFNLFNIKADQRWQGDTVNKETLEYRGGAAIKERASFRSYTSFEESFQDYVQFIQGNARYQKALEHTLEPQRYIQELQNVGYATDPKYSEKIHNVYQGITHATSHGKG